jgi:hypothetical protein
MQGRRRQPVTTRRAVSRSPAHQMLASMVLETDDILRGFHRRQGNNWAGF